VKILFRYWGKKQHADLSVTFVLFHDSIILKDYCIIGKSWKLNMFIVDADTDTDRNRTGTGYRYCTCTWTLGLVHVQYCGCKLFASRFAIFASNEK
jgi:hypothetical protein